MLNHRPRRHLPGVVTLRMVLFVVEIICAVFGYDTVFVSDTLHCAGAPSAVKTVT
jgi:hypothetical protein